MKITKVLLFVGLLATTILLNGQTNFTDFISKPWKAAWITVPNIDKSEYGMYYFRKNFNIQTIPSVFKVNVSGDNRYKLFVNGRIVSAGPARSDVAHWNYEIVDLAPYLQTGMNFVTAKVWNEGLWKSEANISEQTAFILQGNTKDAEILNTDAGWKCIKDEGFSPIPFHINDYYAAGPGECVDMHKVVSDWNSSACNMNGWQNAKVLTNGIPNECIGLYGVTSGWLLQPSPLPQRELRMENLAKVRKSNNLKVSPKFLAGQEILTVPANRQVELLLDQTYLTNAYFTLNFSRGNNSRIAIGYAETLYDKYPAKGNRDDVEGKVFIGRTDSIISNGKNNQAFTSSSWRTYRYVSLKIKTGEEPLVIDKAFGTFTGYPFTLKASLQTDDMEMKRIFDVGWRTARLCAIETYMDCPYYEQLQYLGDTRIQALITLYNTGDDTLVKNFLNQADMSRTPEGITKSRYPETTQQIITPYALSYIESLHDYMMYGSDQKFVGNKLAGVRQILDYFHHYQLEDGSLHKLPWWNFTDWVDDPHWHGGVADEGEDGCSALLDLQLLMGYEVAADMEEKLGMKDFADLYTQRAEQLKQTINNKYWNANRNLYADRLEQDAYSQHTNTLAILTGVANDEQVKAISHALVNDTTLAQASIYFKYYLHEALIKAGLGDNYMNWLDKWRENLRTGLTTWAETSDVTNTRSDCHAWGASPNIEFFRTVLGIDSNAPAFSKIKIEPHLGTIGKIGGEMPHPNGMISVKYVIKNNHLKAVINLPSRTSGTFVWKNKMIGLKEGNNQFDL